MHKFFKWLSKKFMLFRKKYPEELLNFKQKIFKDKNVLFIWHINIFPIEYLFFFYFPMRYSYCTITFDLWFDINK